MAYEIPVNMKYDSGLDCYLYFVVTLCVVYMKLIPENIGEHETILLKIIVFLGIQ